MKKSKAKKKKKVKKAKPQKVTVAKKTGRPTKYRESFCDAMINFFDVEPFSFHKVPHFEKTGKVDRKGNRVVVWYDSVRVVNKLPTMVGFSRFIGVAIRTMYNWMDPENSAYHEEFLHTYTRTAKELQKDFLIQCGLMGLHNPAYAKFAAINMTNMRDVKSEEYDTSDRLTELLKEISGQSKDIPALNKARLKLVRGSEVSA